MDRAKILELIRAHNAIHQALTDSELIVKKGALLKAIVVWDKIAMQAANLVNIARDSGINCIYNAQNGYITIKE